LNDAYNTGTPAVADIDKDGHLDIAFAGGQRVMVYYGDADNAFTRVEEVPVGAKTMVIGDVNGDGWLDLVCPIYTHNGSRATTSYVMLGSSDGYDEENRLEFFTNSGTGSMISDFNHDGYMDILFYCHRSDGSHEEL